MRTTVGVVKEVRLSVLAHLVTEASIKGAAVQRIPLIDVQSAIEVLIIVVCTRMARQPEGAGRRWRRRRWWQRALVRPGRGKPGKGRVTAALKAEVHGEDLRRAALLRVPVSTGMVGIGSPF